MSEQKSKFDLEMEAWERAFGDKKQLKIVLYGAGRITATLISRQEGYQIIGICDRNSEMVGNMMYGVPIVEKQYVEEHADLLVINTSESYWNTIYDRICDWNIPIYYRNGQLAKGRLKEDKDDPYWENSFDELEERINDCAYLSFDVFDTLIMRKIVAVSDLFQIMEQNLQNQLGYDVDFVEVRKQAASNLDNPTFDEIYEEISRISDWDSETVLRAKQCEWDVEEAICVPRKSIVKVFEKYRNEKNICLISDMYYTSEQIQALLKKSGIEVDVECILVSSELHKTKMEGDLWRYYKDFVVKNEKALHIGDNRISDVEKPLECGIDAYYIRSVTNMLEHSSIKSVISHVESLYSSVNIGVLATKLCDNPFVLNDTCGEMVFDSLQLAGYSIWGNVLCCFFDWLYEEAKRMQTRNMVFFAREGYLLVPLFRQYLRLRGLDEDIQVFYLEISRRAIMCASIENRKEIQKIAEFPYEGNVVDFFFERFHIPIVEEKYKTISYAEAKNTGALNKIIDEYEQDILLEAAREKKNYLKYLKEGKLPENFVVVDSQIYGSTQYYLSKVLGKKINGLYMCVALGDTNEYKKYNEMRGCFMGVDGTDGMDSAIYRYAPFTESFFTAPNGMFLYVDDYGEKVYTEKKKNQEKFDVRVQMKTGIEEFLQDSIAMTDKLQIKATKDDRALADYLFETWMNGGFIPPEEMKRAFWYDNALVGNKEVPIWE